MPDSYGSPEQQQHFQEMFGESAAELARRGIDPEQFAREHASDGIDNVYEMFAGKNARGESLLPYRAPVAWIARGVTYFAKSRIGSISVDRDAIRLTDGEKVMAEFKPVDTLIRRIPIWFGMGVRLIAKNQEDWCVQPRYSPMSIPRARSAMRTFRAALDEAGVREA